MTKNRIVVLILILSIIIGSSLNANAVSSGFQGDVEGRETKSSYYKSFRLFYPNIESSFLNRTYDFHASNMNEDTSVSAKVILGNSTIQSVEENSLEMIFMVNNQTIDLDDPMYNFDFKVSTDGNIFSSGKSDLEKQSDETYKYKDSIKGYQIIFENNPSLFHKNISYQSTHKIKLDLDKITEAQRRGQEKLPDILSSKNIYSDDLTREWGHDIYIINPSISGTIFYENLPTNVEKPTGTNLLPKSDIQVNLIEKTDTGNLIVSTAKTDANGRFKFSNIDGEPFKLKDSKNELFITIDEDAYSSWSFHNNLIEKLDETSGSLAKITDISRYQDEFENVMKNVEWSDEFKTLETNGERAKNFQVILTDKSTSNYGSVTVKYLDKFGNEISDSETLSGKIGESYKTVPKSINNYKLFGLEGASPEGKFSSQSTIVKYIYEKEPLRGSVTAQYLDVHGNSIAYSESFYGEIGNSYNTNRKSISNYSFKKTEGASTSGEFIAGNLIVKYIYEKDTDTKDPKKPDPIKPDPIKPQPPTKEKEIGKVIEPKVEYELNKDDHFAYIKGYPDITVQPNSYITREEVAMVIYRLMEPEYRNQIKTSSHNFIDMTDETWSTKAISTLTKGDILKGYSDGSFKPHANMTRAEISKVIARFTDTMVLETHFPDILGHWAENYINTLQKNGWIDGYETGEFKPNDLLTRAEFVTIMNNFLDRKVHKENTLSNLKQFKDLPEEWYYTQMIEAINGHEYELDRLPDGTETWTKLVDTKFPDK